MRLVCPSCGAVHSADAWFNDPIARQCLKLAGEMPHAVASRCFAYLSLFRPPGRSLQWKKVLRLLSELKEMVTLPHVQWEKKVARPNSAHAWGTAMERMIEHPPKRLPLKSHGYLRSVAYEIADEMDRKREVKKNQGERDRSRGTMHRARTERGQEKAERDRSRGTMHRARTERGQEKAEPERVSVEDMKAIRKKNYRK